MNIQMPQEDHDAAADDNEMDDDVAPSGNANPLTPDIPGRQLHEGYQYRDDFCNWYFKYVSP